MKRQGTYQNPISVEDEQQQEKNITEDMLQKARNQAIIDEAVITGSHFDICMAVVKTTIAGSIQHKTRRLNKQIIKYFYEQLKIKIHSQHFNKKIQPDYSNPSTEPNPCVLMLYGVDFLTNQMIIDRFKVLGTKLKEINWIDDSSCKMVYGSAQQAQKVLHSQLKDQFAIKVEQQNHQELSREWFVLKPYLIFSFERQLLMRYVTNKETNHEKNKLNRFQQFEIAEVGLYHHLLTTFDASQQYQRIMDKLQSEKMLQRSRRRSVEPRNRSRNDRKKGYNNSQADFQINSHKRLPANQSKRRCDNDQGKFSYRNKRRQEGGPRQILVRQITKKKYEHRPVDMNELSFERINYVTGDGNNRNRTSSVQYGKTSIEISKVYYDCEEQPSVNLSFEVAKDLNLSFENANLRKDNREQDNLELSYAKGNKNIDQEHYQDSISLNLSLKHTHQQNLSKNANIDTSFNLAPKQQQSAKQDNNLSFKHKTFDYRQYDKQSDDQDLSNFLQIDDEISPIGDISNCSMKIKQKPQKQQKLQLSKQTDTELQPVLKKGKKCPESIFLDSDSGY